MQLVAVTARAEADQVALFAFGNALCYLIEEKRRFAMNEVELRTKIREAAGRIEQSARVLLYGSRARGDARPDSDWDILVLLEGYVDHARAQRVRRAIYEVEWETGEVLSTIVRSKDDWESSLSRTTPLYKNVANEAVPV